VSPVAVAIDLVADGDGSSEWTAFKRHEAELKTTVVVVVVFFFFLSLLVTKKKVFLSSKVVVRAFAVASGA
jgi:hypothetical protein